VRAGGFARQLRFVVDLLYNHLPACTAFVADRLGNPPETSWQLAIIAKTKQKAAN
jgi:hypothetical protein